MSDEPRYCDTCVYLHGVLTEGVVNDYGYFKCPRESWHDGTFSTVKGIAMVARQNIEDLQRRAEDVKRKIAREEAVLEQADALAKTEEALKDLDG